MAEDSWTQIKISWKDLESQYDKIQLFRQFSNFEQQMKTETKEPVNDISFTQETHVLH